MDDTVSRKAAIDAINSYFGFSIEEEYGSAVQEVINGLPPAQPERLTDDDFETIRIHLSAFKERLCNQHRWKEAEDYERLIGRFISFASAQTEVKPIDYQDCANAMLKMWMDNIVTDGEYNRIMDKLNAHWRKKNG